MVTFAAGFSAMTAGRYQNELRKYFPDIVTAAGLGDEDLERIRASGDAVKYKRRMQACVNNARAMQKMWCHKPLLLLCQTIKYNGR